MEKQKKQVLFLTRTLGRAGVGVSLMSLLKVIDFDKYDLTLGVQFPEKGLEKEVPECVNIIYYGEITSPLYKKIFDYNSALAKRRHNPVQTLVWHLLNRLEEWRMVYKVRRCFKKKYDTAVAYHQGMASKYVMNHTKADKKIMWYHASVIERPWYKELFRKADKVITDSENARRVMLGEWGSEFEEKIVSMNCVIPLDDILLKSEQRTEFEKDESKTLILSCGRLGEEKGMDIAAKAAGIIKEKQPDFKFEWIIVGDGSERAKIEKIIADFGLEKQFKLLGFQLNPYPYFKICDIYVQPSRLEAFGLTMAEAMCFNKPVITTATAGGKENITDGENGLVCDIDENALANSVLKMVNDKPLREKIIANITADDYRKEIEKKREFVNSVLDSDIK